MRLLWAQDAFWPDIRGGGERRAHCLVRALCALGHQVDVLARKTVPVGPEHESLGNARVFRIETREIGDRWWRIRPWLRMRQWGDIYEAFLEDRQYDGAIVFQPEAAHYLRRRRPRLPILIATGGTWQGSKEYYFSSRNSTLLARLTGELRYRQYRRYEVLGNYAATFVIAESRNVHEQLVRWYALPPERVRIIGNGVEGDVFRPRPSEKAELRRDAGLPDRPFLLIGVGRLARVKNFEYMIRAVQLAAKSHDVHGVIVGSGDQEAVLRELATELGVSDRLHLLGHRMDVADLLAASDAFLLPSLSEPYGNAWPEAMATGLPCMGLRRQFGRVNSAAEEHITDGVTGYIVDPDDPADCARRICQLAGLPQMLESMGAEARRIALAKYRWEVTAAQYAALIMEGRAAT